MRSPSADRYWAQFIASLPSGAARPHTYYEAFRFGQGFGATPAESDAIATQIGALVLAGVKTSTGSLAWVYEAEGRPMPKAGDLSIVLDGRDQPIGIVETTEVRIVPFDEMVDERFAYEAGEDDRTLASWRRKYWQSIRRDCARLGREPSEKAPLVCERFRVVYREALKGEAAQEG